MFCAHARIDPEILRKICIKGGQIEKITEYDQTRFNNLSCREGDEGKVLLDPGNGTPWQLVQDALVVCEYYIAKNYHPTWAYGRGWHENDVFKYTWDTGRKGWIAEGNYPHFLAGMIPRPPPEKITTGGKSDREVANATIKPLIGTSRAVPGYKSSSSGAPTVGTVNPTNVPGSSRAAPGYQSSSSQPSSGSTVPKPKTNTAGLYYGATQGR